MHKALSKAVVVVVMLVVFLGQAMAMHSLISNKNSDKNSYQSSYQNSSSANSFVNSEKPQINDLALADCSDPICCDLDCCDNDCICAASGCSSLLYLSSEIGTVQLAIVSEALPLPQLKQANSVISIHYRPPIFTLYTRYHSRCMFQSA